MSDKTRDEQVSTFRAIDQFHRQIEKESKPEKPKKQKLVNRLAKLITRPKYDQIDD